jgi:glutathione S-transferase/RNA polymerase-associated protein
MIARAIDASNRSMTRLSTCRTIEALHGQENGMSTQRIRIFEHPLSPYVQKVKIALREKGVAFETIGPFSQDADAWAGYARHSPRGEVPAWVEGDLAIFDSSVILQYVEERWPEPALLPPDPAARARMRMLEDVMDTHFEANTWGLGELRFFGRAEGELAERLATYGAREIRTWFGWLETVLAGRDWFNGDAFGWGDLCVVPFVNGATRFDLRPESDSALARWLARANDRDSVAQTRREAEGAELDPDVMRQALAGGFKREYRDQRLEWMVKAGGLSVVADGLEKGNIRFIEPFAAS